MNEQKKQWGDVSLQSVQVKTTDIASYTASKRMWQGIPGICWAGGNRLLATWYSGGQTEGPDNYVLVGQSDDFGETWQEPVAVVMPDGQVRAFDPTIWRDPSGQVWLFWAQGWSPGDLKIWDGRAGVWCSVCEDPTADKLIWSEPRRLSDGIMLNKPYITANGDWLLPVSIWNLEPFHPQTEGRRLAGLVVSRDCGNTFQWVGGAKILSNAFDEHVIFERGSNELVLWSRTCDGMAQSHSTDGGITWSQSAMNGMACPNSRFSIARMPSGKLLLVTHIKPDMKKSTYVDCCKAMMWHGRNNLGIMLSDDDGQTWSARCVIDERQGVSYPDVDVTPDGRIVLIYDYDRFGQAEINVVVMSEQDILRARCPGHTTVSKLMTAETV